MTLGPWLKTLTSGAAESRTAVVDRSRHTRVGSSPSVAAWLSRIRVSVPGAIEGTVHTTSSSARARVVPAGALAPVKRLPGGAVTVTAVLVTGAVPVLVSRIRDG